MPRIVVAGASLGGLRVAEQLRAAGWEEEIVVVGAEPHPPYQRPPLSKEVLAGRAPVASVALRPRPSVADVHWRHGTAVTGARLADRVVQLTGGDQLRFDGLVVATGVRARELTCPGPVAGRHRIRTLDDARALHAVLTRPGARVVVAGAGFIGCEVAATATALGAASVTVVEPERLPLLRPLGELLAAELLARHRQRGVRFALKHTVARFAGPDRVTGVVLDDGVVLPADVVVEAVGTQPNIEWLQGNGLDLADGVRCDEQLRVAGRPDVVAVGDVARFPNARYDGVPRRVEHWCIAGDTARHAARTLATGLAGGEVAGPPFAPLPSFWSDQYGFRLQSYGAPALGLGDVRVLWSAPPGSGSGSGSGDAGSDDLVVGYHAAGRLVGVAALGGPAALRTAAGYRAELLHQPTLRRE